MYGQVDQAHSRQGGKGTFGRVHAWSVKWMCGRILLLCTEAPVNMPTGKTVFFLIVFCDYLFCFALFGQFLFLLFDIEWLYRYNNTQCLCGRRASCQAG